MNNPEKVTRLNGFALVEQLFSLVVISLLFPITLAAFSLSLGYKKDTVTESMGAEISSYVFSQLPYAWREEPSLLFPGEAPLDFPELSESGGFILLFSESGLPYDASPPLEIGDTDWLLTEADGTFSIPPAATSGYIVTVEHVGETNPLLNPELMRSFQVTVAHPAGAPRGQRTEVVYTKVLRKR